MTFMQCLKMCHYNWDTDHSAKRTKQKSLIFPPKYIVGMALKKCAKKGDSETVDVVKYIIYIADKFGKYK